MFGILEAIIIYSGLFLLVTLNHKSVYILLVLDRNTWNNITATKKDIDMQLTKAWTAIDRLLVI